MKCAAIFSFTTFLASLLLARACIKDGETCVLNAGDATDCIYCCSGEASQPLIGGSVWSSIEVSTLLLAGAFASC